MLAAGSLLCLLSGTAWPQSAQQHDGSHDFDFLIGGWKAHVKRLPDRLVGSNAWIEYDGISRHKKILDSNANFEEFEVDNPEKHLHIKAQTLRLYNPDSHQWMIYLVDVDKGTLGIPPVVGQFTGRRGEFYDQEEYKGRAILVRYVWTDAPPIPLEWSSRSRPTEGSPGRSIGFASCLGSVASVHSSLERLRFLHSL